MIEMQLKGNSIKEVKSAIERLKKTDPFLRYVANRLLNNFRMGFRKQQAPDGTPWAKTKRGGQILSLSRRLRNSLQAIVKRNQIRVGTNTIYGAVHNFGHPKKNIQKREFIGFSAAQKQLVINAHKKWAQGGIQ